MSPHSKGMKWADAIKLQETNAALLEALEEMLSAFVPTLKSEFRLTQGQSGAIINARNAIKKAKGG